MTTFFDNFLKICRRPDKRFRTFSENFRRFPEITKNFKRRTDDVLIIHGNGDLFTSENNMLFSRVKTSRLHTKAHLEFHWCLYNKSGLTI